MAAEGVLVTMEAPGLDQLARELRRASLRLRLETREALVEMGAELAREARQQAADAGSKSIPPTIRVIGLVSEGGHEAVEVRAGSPSVPLAWLWEKGNRGSKATAATFRHPVFGNTDNWVEQPKHRYLAAARRRTRPFMTEQLLAALKRTTKGTNLEFRKEPL